MLGKRLRILLVLTFLGAIVGIPTVHSNINTSFIVDASTHDVPPSPWTGRIFHVDGQDILFFKFRAQNGAFRVQVCYSDSGTCASPTYGTTLWNETVSDQGGLKHFADRNGNVTLEWKPLDPGISSLSYEIRIVPNPTRLSLYAFIPQEYL